MSGSSKIHNPALEKRVVRDLALGKSQSQIGREIGVDRRTVGHWARSRDDIKALVEQEQIRLMAKVPDAVDYISGLIPKNGKSKRLDHRDKDLAYKATGDVLRAAGILPSTVPSQIITNIYQEKALINPIILQLLEERDKKFEAIGEVVDVGEEEKS